MLTVDPAFTVNVCVLAVLAIARSLTLHLISVDLASLAVTGEFVLVFWRMYWYPVYVVPPETALKNRSAHDCQYIFEI